MLSFCSNHIGPTLSIRYFHAPKFDLPFSPFEFSFLKEQKQVTCIKFRKRVFAATATGDIFSFTNELDKINEVLHSTARTESLN